jgi:hypothetical protein
MANGPGIDIGMGIGIGVGVPEADAPAEPGSVMCPGAPESLLLAVGVPAEAFSAFLLASVVRRFSTAPCISPDAHRPVSC